MRICICVFVPIHLKCHVLHTALCVQEACSACHAGEHFARQEISPKNVLRFDPLQILAFARKCSGQLHRNVFYYFILPFNIYVYLNTFLHIHPIFRKSNNCEGKLCILCKSTMQELSLLRRLDKRDILLSPLIFSNIA